jgi:hypothetical protein
VTPATSRVTAGVSLAAIGAANVLVILKYAPRVAVPGAALGAVYVAVVLAGAWCATRRPPLPAAWRRIVPGVVVALAVVLLFAVLERVPPERLRVTRWSAITAFNDACCRASFPTRRAPTSETACRDCRCCS